MFTIHVLDSICKAYDNLRMRGRTSKSARNILNDVRTIIQRLAMYELHLDICLKPCCRMVFKNQFSRLLKTED